MVEKMTAAPLPLVESSDNYLSTSSDSSVSSSSEESDSEDRLSNTSWYIFIYLHCCS